MSTYKFVIGCKPYQLPKFIIDQIPTLKNAIENSPSEQEYVLYRSPILFEHVLSFVIDDTYQFPMEYYTELDFYDVKYVKENLYNPFKLVNDFLVSIEDNLNLLDHKIDKINEEMSYLKIATNRIENIVNSNYHEIRISTNYACGNSKCIMKISAPDRFCAKCVKSTKGSCFYGYLEGVCGVKCYNFVEENTSYCTDHLPGAAFCSKENCRNLKMRGGDKCVIHC
jgi:hypothetical protein